MITLMKQFGNISPPYFEVIFDQEKI